MDQLPTWTIDAGYASALSGFASALIRKKLKAVDDVALFPALPIHAAPD
jgi:hypothetical protein